MDDSASPPATEASSLRKHLSVAVSAFTAAFGWLMCTLAAGAVAAFASMVLMVRPCWLILLLALPLTWILKQCGCLYPRWAGIVAALAVLLAGFYATCLVATARIAAVTGFTFADAFRTGGFGLVLQVAELGLDAKAILAYAAAAILAGLLAIRMARPRAPHARM